MIDVSVLDMLYSQYGGGDNQQETMQKLNALQQWQQPQQQQNRRYGPWEAIAQIANAYAQKQGLQRQQQAPAAPMQAGEGVPSILEALIQSRGGV